MNPNRIKPEDRYTVVRSSNDHDPVRLGGYVIDCKECGRIDRRASLVEAKEIRDAHEPYHHPGEE